MDCLHRPERAGMATSLLPPDLMIPPRVDLDDGDDPSTLVRGTPEWLRRAGLVRGALEAHGCVAVGCRRRVQPELRDRMLVAMAELFALPDETKRRTGDADGPYKAFGVLLPYMERRDSAACRLEAFAVLNACSDDGVQARAFVARAWPDGNGLFLETLTSTAGEMTRLARVILAMVIDSYGVAHRSDEIVGTADANFRMLRYRKDSLGTSPPDEHEQPAVGLAAHVDGSYLTVLFQNNVDGLELRTRSGGEWARVRPAGPDSVLVVAGQALVAWSNGRVHAPLHRVAVGGREDRLSCGVFLQPSKDHVVDAPPELVTADAPRRFRPFVYEDYLRFKHAAGNGEDVLSRFAGMF